MNEERKVQSNGRREERIGELKATGEGGKGTREARREEGREEEREGREQEREGRRA